MGCRTSRPPAPYGFGQALSSSSVRPLVSTANQAITAPTAPTTASCAKTRASPPPAPMTAPTATGPRMTPHRFHRPPNAAPLARLDVG